MKRLLLLLGATLCTICSLHAQVAHLPQQQLIDVIYLENGQVLSGTIIEQVPGVSYHIVTTDGREFKVDALNIKKITKEPLRSQHIVIEGYNAYHDLPLQYKYDSMGNIITPLSVSGALIRSMFMPGLGQFYNGEAGKGAILLGANIAGLAGVILSNTHISSPYDSIVGWPSLVVWIGSYLYSLIDAPISAANWNKSQGFFGPDTYIELSPSIGTTFGTSGRENTVGLNLSLTF